jgi:hypothetical protein
VTETLQEIRAALFALAAAGRDCRFGAANGIATGIDYRPVQALPGAAGSDTLLDSFIGAKKPS